MGALNSARRLARPAFERLPDNVRVGIRRTRDELVGLGQIKINQALLAKHLADLEQQQTPIPRDPEVADPRFPDGVRSRLCTQVQLEEPWFRQWCDALGEPPLAHRKMWEFTYIAEVLDALGMLKSGRRGLGFGVGREPLIAAFANRGIDIMATDLDPDAREALGWVRSGQHASRLDSVESMARPGVCDEATFKEHVSWRAVDMREIPTDLRGFDFCWSACSLEHLGTLAAGADFIEQSLATLVPGGIAVHTTEFNVGSNDDTIEAGATVVYRERDLIDLKTRLESAGHEVAAFNFARGEGLLDNYVDVPPYADEPVLRFLAGKYTLTSVAIIVRARPA